MPWSKVPMKDAHGVRYAWWSCQEALIPRSPNGAIHPDLIGELRWEYIPSERARAELKHLSRRRKREQKFIPPVVASEKGGA